MTRALPSGLFRALPVRQFFVLPLLFLIQGCSNYSALSTNQTEPAGFPSDRYQQADPNYVYPLDSEASQIIVTVRRGGLMARLGHDHIVSSNHVQGFIFLDSGSGQCTADLFVPIAMLEVDNAKLRTLAAMTTTPSAADIKGTRGNMLKSIEGEDFPFAQLHSSDCFTSVSGNKSTVELTIHGVTQQRKLDIALEQARGDELVISGTFSILQSDFGITPFSIMNGLIKVEDKLDLSFRLIAKKSL